MTSLAAQFLVDDLTRSVAYYRKLGFEFGQPWDGFYAIGQIDGLERHLKEAPKNEAERRYRRDNEHLDASAGVDGIEAFYERCVSNGATILKPLASTDWGTKDFYVEDPDGYILCSGGQAGYWVTTPYGYSRGLLKRVGHFSEHQGRLPCSVTVGEEGSEV